MRVRRALLTAVRPSITRVAFFADFVFAIGIQFRCGDFVCEARGYSLGLTRRQMINGA
jgi:hypothetical protein